MKKEMSIEEIIDWLSEHETVWDDFCKKFGIDASFKESSCIDLLFPKQTVTLLRCDNNQEEVAI